MLDYTHTIRYRYEARHYTKERPMMLWRVSYGIDWEGYVLRPAIVWWTWTS